MEKIILVTGGGKTCRNYVEASKKLCNPSILEKDWIGIMATRLNGELVRVIFGKDAYKKVVIEPEKKVKFEKILIAAGGVPGHSSDMDAVLLAKTFTADTVINLSNIEYVYDKLPSRFKNAKKIKECTWKEYLKIEGRKWDSAMNTPFDPIASKMAMKLGLKVVVAKGSNLANLKRILNNEKFKGTLISR